jgi:hypothetical protein
MRKHGIRHFLNLRLVVVNVILVRTILVYTATVQNPEERQRSGEERRQTLVRLRDR